MDGGLLIGIQFVIMVLVGLVALIAPWKSRRSAFLNFFVPSTVLLVNAFLPLEVIEYVGDAAGLGIALGVFVIIPTFAVIVVSLVFTIVVYYRRINGA
jgi:hypothetical protein